MSKSASLDLQKAFNTALKSDADLSAIIGQRVYDRVPKNAVFPYVQIGDDQEIDNANTCDSSGVEVYTRVHIWSRDVGVVEAKKIMGLIKPLLVQPHILDDFYITVNTFVSADFVSAQDELETHVVMTFRFLARAK